MDDLQLLIDLHLDAPRQGPGSEAQTRRAIELCGLAGRPRLEIADIGCGTGASTLVLARDLDARIMAIDFVPAFLARLQERARDAGLSERISTHAMAMQDLDLPEATFDAIWSEGAIYNIGFEAGVRNWRRFLKPGGMLAASELTWLTHDRAQELDTHWHAQYPEVGTASSKIAVLERNGYTPVGYFVLPQVCWLQAYYRPMQQRFAAFLRAHGSSPAARAIVAAEEREIDLYERFQAQVGYGFYIAQKAR